LLDKLRERQHYIRERRVGASSRQPEVHHSIGGVGGVGMMLQVQLYRIPNACNTQLVALHLNTCSSLVTGSTSNASFVPFGTSPRRLERAVIYIFVDDENGSNITRAAQLRGGSFTPDFKQIQRSGYDATRPWHAESS
jgi:hypothetical protein